MTLLTCVSNTDQIIVDGKLVAREPVKKEPVIMSCYTQNGSFRFATKSGITTTSTVQSDNNYGKYRVIMTRNSAYVFAND